MADGVTDDPTDGVDPTDVGAVADVLYRLAPDRFVAVRTAFVKAARAGGDRDAAREIQGFGRPTRAAWVLNLLARDAPDVVEQLVGLGTALAEAQADLDASSLRELSDRRRALVREVATQAFGIAGDTAPSTALAVEVQDTLTAAVVDPAVGEALRAGALLKAAQASGFGPAGPELAAVPRPRALKSVPAPTQPSTPRTATGSAQTNASGTKSSKRAAAEPSAPKVTAAKPTAAQKKAQAAAAREAEKARRAAEQQAEARRARIAAADAALGSARAALEAARAAETEAQDQIRILREQLRDADRAAGDAGLAVREARAAVRTAEKARRESR